MSTVKDYRVEVSKLTMEDGGGYMAYMPELNCFGDGETPEDAIADVYAVAEDLIAIAIEDGKDVPAPQYYKDLDEFSGKLSIRLPKTLHKQLSLRAKTEECSINQLIANYIAMGIGDAYGRAESLLLKEENYGRGATALAMVSQDFWTQPKRRGYGSSKNGIVMASRGVYVNEEEI